MNRQAEALFQQKDKTKKQEAVSLLVTAINQAPKQLDNYLQLAAYLTAMQDFEQAEDLLQKALQQFPDNSALQYNLGVLYYEAGALTQAEQQFNQLVSQAPTAENDLMLSRIYFKKQNFAKAFAFALTAHDQDSQNEPAVLMMADCLLSLGQLQPAQNYYQQAAKLKPDDMAALFGAGMVQYILHEDDGQLQKVKQADPAYFKQQQERLVAIEKLVADQKKAADHAD